MSRLAAMVAAATIAGIAFGAEPHEQIQAIGERAVEKLGDWQLHQVDSEPSVEVGEQTRFSLLIQFPTQSRIELKMIFEIVQHSSKAELCGLAKDPWGNHQHGGLASRSSATFKDDFVDLASIDATG